MKALVSLDKLDLLLKTFQRGTANLARGKKAVVVLQHFIALAEWKKMVLLADVSNDQKRLGSVLAISSDVLTGNKVTPVAAMQPVDPI